jgi:hypothetical protein
LELFFFNICENVLKEGGIRMKKANMNSSLRPNGSNQSDNSSSKLKKVKKRGCGCGKRTKRLS